MNTLMEMRDDGISALVWAKRVESALSEGKTVIVLSDERNQARLIGTGDDVPTLDSITVGDSDRLNVVPVSPSTVVEDYKRVLNESPESTAIFWNVDIFRLCENVSETDLVELFKVISNSSFTTTFVSYSNWCFRDFAELLTTAMRIGIVEGCLGSIYQGISGWDRTDVYTKIPTALKTMSWLFSWLSSNREMFPNSTKYIAIGKSIFTATDFVLPAFDEGVAFDVYAFGGHIAEMCLWRIVSDLCNPQRSGSDRLKPASTVTWTYNIQSRFEDEYLSCLGAEDFAASKERPVVVKVNNDVCSVGKLDYGEAIGYRY